MKPIWRDVLFSTLHLSSSIALLLLGATAYLLGILPNLLVVFAMGMAAYTVLSRAIQAYRRDLAPGWILRPIAADSRKQLFQFVLRLQFWILVAYTLKLALIPAQFSAEEWASINRTIAACWFVSVIGLLLPFRTVRLSANLVYIAGVLVLGSLCIEAVRSPDEPAVAIDAPFEGNWLVVQGGMGSMVNHHAPIKAQRHALDLAKVADGQLRSGDPNALTSYPSFDQPILAPADGKVIAAVNDRPDIAIGAPGDLKMLQGNHLILEIAPERFVLLAHLKKGSVAVKEGDTVKRGQAIARCGNSGNTTFPHLHIQIQDKPAFGGKDVRTFPITFADADRIRGAQSASPADALRRNDVIRPR